MCEAASAGDPCYSFEKNTKRRHEDANEGEAPTDTNAHERNTRTQNTPGRSSISTETVTEFRVDANGISGVSAEFKGFSGLR